MTRRRSRAKTACRLGLFIAGLYAGCFARAVQAQEAGANSLAVEESAYYVIETIKIPEGVVLEVGGMALLPSGDLAAATRRGEIWIIEHPDGWGASPPHFRLFARGLHEPLGLAYHGGALYAAQRGELTRIEDRDGDGRADAFTTAYDWPVSGNYHEYSFGPVFRKDGRMIVALNLSSLGPMESLAKWRGWMLEVTRAGEMKPLATGMRSPSGIQVLSDGAVFYTENQGDWIGSGWLTHVEAGDFVGQPKGLRWSGEPESPLSVKPEEVPDTSRPMFEVREALPELKPPAVWLPHGILGISASGLLEDTTGGAFGPFAGQLFVGDQGHSKIMRVALEQVDGVYQGVAFPFREGFQSGVLRMIWDAEGTMYVGMTGRGWNALGGAPYGLQRLRWSGLVPFEAQTVHAMPDGFEIRFTQQPDTDSVSDPASYTVTSFTYMYHSTYGSPVIRQREHDILAARATAGGKGVRLVVDSLRQGYIYEIKMPGIRSNEHKPLLHDTGYYTLNRIPEGERLELTGVPRREPRQTEEQARPSPDSGLSGEDGGRGAESSAAQPKRVPEMPSGWGRPDATITVGTLPGLRFDLPSFSVAPGARVQLVFHNNDDMLHNVVLVRPGTEDTVAADALALGLEGAEKGYVPDADEVLFHTALLEPGQTESIFFTAPSVPGEYTYICTFPGHAVTMRGTMRVVR